MSGIEHNPLRLLLVTPRYFPLMGGVENHVYQVASRFARAGIDTTVLTTNPGGRLRRIEQIEGVTVRRALAWPAKRDYYFAPDIYRAISSEAWDIVHIQSYHTLVAPLAMLAALRARIPYLVTFHGGGHSSRLRNALRRPQWAMLRPLLARAERLIAIAKFEIALFGQALRIPPERFALIPNGADLPSVQSAPAKTSATLIASIGRLERYKGHHRIIEALPKILEHRPDTQLWIAGTGPYESTLRNLAHNIGVAQQVIIRAIPPNARAEMANGLAQTALVVLLSEYETHPIAVLEALALRRPVLVADTSGLSELVQRGLVRGIPLESTPEQVAIAVLEQLRRPHVPASINLPTWDDCAASLLDLYSTIARRPRCAY